MWHTWQTGPKSRPVCDVMDNEAFVARQLDRARIGVAGFITEARQLWSWLSVICID
jgi:hypothetical protein